MFSSIYFHEYQNDLYNPHTLFFKKKRSYVLHRCPPFLKLSQNAPPRRRPGTFPVQNDFQMLSEPDARLCVSYAAEDERRYPAPRRTRQTQRWYFPGSAELRCSYCKKLRVQMLGFLNEWWITDEKKNLTQKLRKCSRRCRLPGRSYQWQG